MHERQMMVIRNEVCRFRYGASFWSNCLCRACHLAKRSRFEVWVSGFIFVCDGMLPNATAHWRRASGPELPTEPDSRRPVQPLCWADQCEAICTSDSLKSRRI